MPDSRRGSERAVLGFLLFLAVTEVSLFLAAWITGAEVGENYLPTLLSAKVTFVSLLVATLTFLYRTFWDEVKNLPKPVPATGAGESATGRPRDRPAAVLAHYQLYTLMLLAAIFSTFAAIVADLFIAVGQTNAFLRSFSISTVLSAFAVVIVFVGYFAWRTMGEMRAVIGAGARD